MVKKIIDMDATIKSFLDAYAKNCADVLQKHKEKLKKNKFSSDKERNDAMAEVKNAENSYKFLLSIVKEPKKYLYSGKDIIYEYVEDGVSIYHKLTPILVGDYAVYGSPLVELSKYIANHVKHGKNEHGVWIYRSGSTVSDYDAEGILKLNRAFKIRTGTKLVNYLNSWRSPLSFAKERIN